MGPAWPKVSSFRPSGRSAAANFSMRSTRRSRPEAGRWLPARTRDSGGRPGTRARVTERPHFIQWEKDGVLEPREQRRRSPLEMTVAPRRHESGLLGTAPAYLDCRRRKRIRAPATAAQAAGSDCGTFGCVAGWSSLRHAVCRRYRSVAGPVAALIAVAVFAAAVSGCGSSSGALTTSHHAAGVAPEGVGTGATRLALIGGVSVRSVERALVARGGPPAPSAAVCHGASAGERQAAPFGVTQRPVLSCLLTVGGERARYDVQVLANGCFVAERHRPGRAVYGCGADRSH